MSLRPYDPAIRIEVQPGGRAVYAPDGKLLGIVKHEPVGWSAEIYTGPDGARYFAPRPTCTDALIALFDGLWYDLEKVLQGRGSWPKFETPVPVETPKRNGKKVRA